MEIRKLCAADYDELLELLNFTFATKYGREMDFLNEQPKMWVKDDEHMQKHLGAFEDGRLCAVVGIYPLPTVICGEKLLFATTGNVATHPNYEGRGYFTALFGQAMEETLRLGVDVARLGGSRPRYSRYGFVPCGALYTYNIQENTRKKLYKTDSPITFKEVERGDTEALRFMSEVSRGYDMYVERSDAEGYRDLYLTLCSKHAAPYIAYRNGEAVGYISAYGDNQFVGKSKFGRHLAEIRSTSPENTYHIAMCWQAEANAEITVPIAPTMLEERCSFERVCESSTLRSPSHFRFNNIERPAAALTRLKAKTVGLPQGEFVIGVCDFGNYRFYNTGGDVGCERCDKEADITLSYSDAVGLIFGTFEPNITEISPIMRAFFPLPLTWNTNDYV